MRLALKHLGIPAMALSLLLGCVPAAQHTPTQLKKASDVKITAGTPAEPEAAAESKSPPEAESK
jgi:hypothetical protein